MIARLAALSFLASASLATPADAQSGAETIAGWRVEYGGSGDGGHMVRLVRRGRTYQLEHHLEYWRGNGGVAISASFRRGECRSGDGGGIIPSDQGMSRAAFDQRLADYLRECPLSPAEEAALRRTLNAAWPRFAARAAEARAAMEAEAEAIARHGEQR